MKITRILTYGVELAFVDTTDQWSGDIAHRTPTEFLFTTTDCNRSVTVSTAEGAPQRQRGRMAASRAPGLGITPKMDLPGKAVVEVSAHPRAATLNPAEAN